MHWAYSRDCSSILVISTTATCSFLYRIGASVLSQHVDDFTLVAAFFLFVIGCLNMLIGLIFRESAKQRRSIRAWRAGPQDTLPTHLAPAANLNRSATSTSGQSYSSSTVYEEKSRDHAEFGDARSASRAGYGFGRQGEKAAGMKGLSYLPMSSHHNKRYFRLPHLQAPGNAATLCCTPN